MGRRETLTKDNDPEKNHQNPSGNKKSVEIDCHEEE